MLRLVERHVRMLEQFVAVLAVLRGDGYAHGGGHAQMIAAHVEIMREFGHDVAGNPLRFGSVGARTDQPELVPSESRDLAAPLQIGRASGGERGCQYVEIS